MYNQPFSHIPMGKQVTGLRHSNSTFSYFSHLSVTVNMDFIDDINRHSPSTQVNSLIKKQLCIINLFNSLFFFFYFLVVDWGFTGQGHEEKGYAIFLILTLNQQRIQL